MQNFVCQRAYSATFRGWSYFHFLEVSQQEILIALLAYIPSVALAVCVRLLTPYLSRIGDLKQATLLPDQQVDVSVHIDDSTLQSTRQHSFCWSWCICERAKSIQQDYMAEFLFAHDQLASPLACHSAKGLLLGSGPEFLSVLLKRNVRSRKVRSSSADVSDLLLR